MAKRTNNDLQTTTQKINTEQHEPHKKPEGYAVPASHVPPAEFVIGPLVF